MLTPCVDVWNEDCIPGMNKRLEPESCHCCITSIPFGALFMYSGKIEDVGNNLDGTQLHEGQFGLHMRFFIQQLFRILKPGSVACIHIQQLLRYKVQHGFMGMRDFRGAVISLFENHGFQPHGEVAVENQQSLRSQIDRVLEMHDIDRDDDLIADLLCVFENAACGGREVAIVKNPQAVAQRLKLHSLMFITGKRDSRALSPAMNDYILFFRKPGQGEPVQGLYDKKTNPNGWFTQEDWIKWAHGCWTDIHEIDTLEGYRCAKEHQEEKHVCPLQLEVIRRCMSIYTKPGDTVIDPFMGIGSTAYVAIEQGRHCVGFELKASYHRMAVANVKKAQNIFNQNDLFSRMAN